MLTLGSAYELNFDPAGHREPSQGLSYSGLQLSKLTGWKGLLETQITI